jgi:hypothetical protein
MAILRWWMCVPVMLEIFHVAYQMIPRVRDREWN